MLHMIHTILYIIHTMLHIIHTILYIIHSILYIIHTMLYIIQIMLYCTCTLYMYTLAIHNYTHYTCTIHMYYACTVYSLASVTFEALWMVRVAQGSYDTPFHKVPASLTLGTVLFVIVFTAVVMIVTWEIPTRG